MKKIIVILILIIISAGLSSCNLIEQRKGEQARKAFIADSIVKANAEKERIRKSVEIAQKHREEQKRNEAVKNSIVVSPIYFNPPRFEPLYMGRCDIKLKFKNISEKTIKNVTFNFTFSGYDYNTLRCDTTQSRISTVKYEGPLKSGKEVMIKRNGIFYSRLAYEVHYDSILIEYMDDTTLELGLGDILLHIFKEDYV